MNPFQTLILAILPQILDLLLLRPIKGWRTLLLSVCVMISGLSGIVGFTAIVSGPLGGWVLFGIGVATAIVRWDTDTKILSGTPETTPSTK